MATPQLVAVGQRITAQGMNDTVQTALDLQAAVAQALPIVTMRASGSAQPMNASTVTNLFGNQSGWVFDTNNGGGDIQGNVGVFGDAITILRPGLYIVSWTIVHQQIASGRAFTEISLNPGALFGFRAIWSLDDTSSTTGLIPVVTTGVTQVSLNDYSVNANSVGSARITVIKLHD